MEKLILKAAAAISEADTIFISAGAGMGVDSGLPDFRGNHGFWKAYPLLKKENLSFQDLANPSWFRNNPHRAWGFYGHRYKLYKATEPHQGFKILQKWCQTKEIAPFIFTSNVDGHFQKSGFHPDSVYECHGSINHLQCIDGCANNIWAINQLNIGINQARLIATGELPRCPHCSEVARPNILMFGDTQWLPQRSIAQSWNYDQWKAQNSNLKIVTIEIGAGKAIPTARYASESMPGKLIRINPRDSDGYKTIISIPLGSLEALSAIDNMLKML